jgi:predicted Zn-dependent protease with MMP-like domain
VLLIADQFEEIYTLCNNQEIRRQFLDCLLASLETPTSLSSSATVLVTTMRADFLGNALSYRPFADVLRNIDVKLGPMNRGELTEVIEKPAQKLGVTFADGLVERILDDVENQPGILPLLQFALTELWNKRTGKQLTHQIYEEIGQVEGALARHADEKYGNLTDEEKEKVRRIFIQLVRPGEGAEDTRRIAMKAELGEQSWSLVKQLADARLVVTSRNATSQETVEVVHEALIRNWGELREWMNTNRDFRAWQERLRAAKGQWEATNQDSGSLLRGAALAEAEEKLKERPEDLLDEKEFIEQSIQERELIRKNGIRAIWATVVSSLAAVIISSGLALTAWNEKNQAEFNQAESLGRYSLSLFNENKELEAFIQAIRAGKILQSQDKIN